MASSGDFLKYVSEILDAFAQGDHDQIDLTDCPFKGTNKAGIVQSLAAIQDRFTAMAEQTESLTRTAEICQAVAVGDFSANVESKGDWNVLGRAVKHMVWNLRDVVGQVNTIAEGDYSAEIAPRSEKDELGAALFNMTKTLRETTADAQQKVDNLNNLPMTVMAIDKDFNMTYINPAGASLVGSTPEELIGMKCYDQFKTPHCHTGNCRSAQAMQHDRTCNGETVVDPDEMNLPIAYTGAPIKDSAGRIIGAIEYMVDISEIKLAMARTEEATEQLQREIAEGEKLNWIKSGQAGLSDRMRGERHLPSLCKNALSFLAKYLDAQVAVMYVVNNDLGELDLMGSYAYARRKHLDKRIQVGEGLLGQAVLEKEVISISDVPEGYIAVNSGLGESSPSNLVAVPAILNDNVEAVLELGTLRSFNDTQIEFLKLVSENIAVAVKSAQDREKMKILLEESQRQTEELQAQRKKLQLQQEELKASNAELEEQTQLARESEENLKAQSEELRALNEELEEKTKHLQQQQAETEKRNKELTTARIAIEEKARELTLSNKYKSEFLANMSHELRTPLNSVLILAQSLASNDSGTLSDKQVESANVIHASGKDLLNLINDILDLSKVEAGKLGIELQDVEIDAIAADLRKQFTPVAEQKAVEWKIEMADGLPQRFQTDRQRTEQVLKNLLSNAFKFTGAGSVTLSIYRPGQAELSLIDTAIVAGDVIAMSVIDTGIGIPKEKQQDIFEAFQQADGSTSRRFGGSGLGLTISREMTQLLGGAMRVVSREGEGSTFTLYLPLKHAVRAVLGNERNPAASNTLQSQELETSAPAATNSPPEIPDPEFLPDDRQQLGNEEKTALIVEDDTRFAKILMGFSRQRGYKCIAAGDGRSGLLLASKYRPTAIILDIGLPDVDGLSVLDQLKRNPETAHIPVHVISATDETADSLQRGAIGHLTKPATADDVEGVFGSFESMLQAKIESVLVVEDDEAQREALVALIAERGVEVTAVGTGEEAHASITSRRFGCVILDLTLPDMTGFELLRDLGEIADLELPTVVVYTSGELTAEEDAELRNYAEAIVIKGPDFEERVLDEAMLFLHSVASALSDERKGAVRMLHDSDQALQGRKVLLVDDDARNTFALSAALEKEGLDVVMADNGRLALEALEAETDIELVLMDIMMPVMDGYEAMRAIRAKPRLEKLPIIALTAKAMAEDRGKCLEAGANDYLTKPVDLEKLLSLLRVWLFRKEATTA